ncbi:hypothetical protein [Oxalobacter paraformigenes]|nr:hypothetical protein [Oxalobacter paraformigenes]
MPGSTGHFFRIFDRTGAIPAGAAVQAVAAFLSWLSGAAEKTHSKAG